MRIDFPDKHFESFGPVLIPDESLLGVDAPRAPGEGKDPQAVLRRGFEQPIGARRLREAARAGDLVLILIDDYTRGTPVTKVLPHILPLIRGESSAAGEGE